MAGGARVDGYCWVHRPPLGQEPTPTYVATWAGFADVAFVTEVSSRTTVGWRVPSCEATSPSTG